MQTLQWESGATTELRAALIKRVLLLAENPANQRLQRVDLLLAVRFRRVALPDGQTQPPDHRYDVDIALPSNDPVIVTDMLRSRGPREPVRYDLLRVRLHLAGRVAAVIKAPEAERRSAPMMLELVTPDGGLSLFRNTPEDIARLIGQVDSVRSLTPTDFLGTAEDVLRGLTSGANRQSQAWPPRPLHLLNNMQLQMTILHALDGPNSPCAPVARLYRLQSMRGTANALIDYQSLNEQAVFPGANAQNAVRFTLEFGSSDKAAVIGRIKKRPEPRDPTKSPYVLEQTPTVAQSASATYRLSDLRVATTNWSIDQTFRLPLPDNKWRLVLPPTVGDGVPREIHQQAAGLLVDLIRGNAPNVGTENVEWHLLLLVRSYRALSDLLPVQVVEELLSYALGTWCYRLMTRAMSSSDQFWVDWTFHLVSRVTQRQNVILTGMTSEPQLRPFPRPIVTAFNILDEQHPDYAKLARALTVYLLPIYGAFAEWGV